jgi:hypothetical protein
VTGAEGTSSDSVRRIGWAPGDASATAAERCKVAGADWKLGPQPEAEPGDPDYYTSLMQMQQETRAGSNYSNAAYEPLSEPRR